MRFSLILIVFSILSSTGKAEGVSNDCKTWSLKKGDKIKPGPIFIESKKGMVYLNEAEKSQLTFDRQAKETPTFAAVIEDLIVLVLGRDQISFSRHEVKSELPVEELTMGIAEMSQSGWSISKSGDRLGRFFLKPIEELSDFTAILCTTAKGCNLIRKKGTPRFVSFEKMKGEVERSGILVDLKADQEKVCKFLQSEKYASEIAKVEKLCGIKISSNLPSVSSAASSCKKASDLISHLIK